MSYAAHAFKASVLELDYEERRERGLQTWHEVFGALASATLNDVSPVEQELRAVVEAGAERAAELQLPLAAVRGIAFYDTAKDALFTGLGRFPGAVAAVAALPLVQERLGGDQATRAILQFIYEYFKRATTVSFDRDLFNETWVAFCAELETPDWLYRGVANMRHFRCDELRNELGDGIEIRGRSFEDLERLGFARHILEGISEDLGEFGSSSFVVVAEHRMQKDPTNLLVSDGTVWVKAQRTIGALRLLAGGDVSMGRMWLVRPAAFNFGLSGTHVIGFSIPAMGTDFLLTAAIRAQFPTVYSELAQLERMGYGKAPGNLDLALRSFMGTYDRWPPAPDSRLLDSVTALEAVLGSGTELTFKLAFRVAALLAETDTQRSEILDQMKGFYDTRSALVHGGRLKTKHQERLKQVDELRVIVRRLLRSFVHFAAGTGQEYDKQFFQEHLDAALVNSAEREALRAALDLAGKT